MRRFSSREPHCREIVHGDIRGGVRIASFAAASSQNCPIGSSSLSDVSINRPFLAEQHFGLCAIYRCHAFFSSRTLGRRSKPQFCVSLASVSNNEGLSVCNSPFRFQTVFSLYGVAGSRDHKDLQNHPVFTRNSSSPSRPSPSTSIQGPNCFSLNIYS